MEDNNMQLYTLSNKKEPENDPRNLFALRWDLHSLLFDQAKWVVVPMGGEMVVHFIDQSYEAAALYHNKKFNTTNLAHEFLYARFAWAIIECAKSAVGTSRKQFRLAVPVYESQVNEPQEGSAQGSTGTKRGGKKRKIDEPQVNDFNEAEEFIKDLRLAKRVAPYFFEEPGLQTDRYHTIMWYPGQNITERRKREYMDTHPNIRARSSGCPDASSGNSGSEGEDCEIEGCQS